MKFKEKDFVNSYVLNQAIKRDRDTSIKYFVAILTATLVIGLASMHFTSGEPLWDIIVNKLPIIVSILVCMVFILGLEVKWLIKIRLKNQKSDGSKYQFRDLAAVEDIYYCEVLAVTDESVADKPKIDASSLDDYELPYLLVKGVQKEGLELLDDKNIEGELLKVLGSKCRSEELNRYHINSILGNPSYRSITYTDEMDKPIRGAYPRRVFMYGLYENLVNTVDPVTAALMTSYVYGQSGHRIVFLSSYNGATKFEGVVFVDVSLTKGIKESINKLRRDDISTVILTNKDRKDAIDLYSGPEVGEDEFRNIFDMDFEKYGLQMPVVLTNCKDVKRSIKIIDNLNSRGTIYTGSKGQFISPYSNNLVEELEKIDGDAVSRFIELRSEAKEVLSIANSIRTNRMVLINFMSSMPSVIAFLLFSGPSAVGWILAAANLLYLAMFDLDIIRSSHKL